MTAGSNGAADLRVQRPNGIGGRNQPADLGGIREVPGNLTMPYPLYADQSLTRRKRSALDITETEDKLIAAAAIIGDNKIPSTG